MQTEFKLNPKFHHTGSPAGGEFRERRLAGCQSENRFVPAAFTGADGKFAAACRKEFMRLVKKP
jgi:hypothetical protein